MKVLLVEDNSQIAQNIKKGLIQESIIIDIASDGQEGLDLALSEKYDVIVLDIMLPKLDGFEVCKQIRQEKNSIPILMLTAKDQTQDKVRGLNTGADDYLSKPFDFSELVARIRALARRPNKQIGQKLVAQDLELDLLTLEVSRNNKIIKLSKQELVLLEFLMRNPNQVFSAQDLAEKAWNYDSDVLANTAQVYIGYLRKKIDSRFSKNKLIETVRGLGYKLVLK